MERFHGDLITRHSATDRFLSLTEPLVVEIDGEYIIVPSGCRTDLASVPRLAWPIFPPFGRYSVPAAAHDYLYAGGTILGRNGVRYRPSRRKADVILCRLMRARGCWRSTRWIFWTMVRIFGKSRWKI